MNVTPLATPVTTAPATDVSTSERKRGKHELARTASDKSVTSAIDRYPTQWKDIVASSIMYYFMLTVSQALQIGSWPYMLKFDPSTPISYAGFMLSAHRIGHALGTAAFAYFTFVSQNFRKSLLTGRILSAIGCFIYLNIEFFPVAARRYVFLLAFFLNALGEGSSCAIRSYVPRISMVKDRQTAYSVVNGANMLAIISGPAAQIICTAFSAQGISLGLSQLKLSLYTGPIWISLFLNLGAIYISIFRFSEPKMSSIEQLSGDGSLRDSVRSAYRQFAKLDRSLIAVCFVEKSIASIGFVAMLAMLSPYILAVHNISSETGVKTISIGQGICGFISLVTVALFVFTRVCKKFKGSVLFPFALACYFLMFFSSYPLLPLTGRDIVVRNETQPNGCDTTKYAWCEHESVVALHLWLPVTVMVMGVAIPVSFIAFDTIYSHVLGVIDQNLMQGAVAIMDDIASAAAPAIATATFAAIGPLFWYIFAAVMLAGLLLWMPIYPRLKKMKI